ncbi:MAG: hypothetical protein AB7F43_00790 [Bacteriovoracia bacterium]
MSKRFFSRLSVLVIVSVWIGCSGGGGGGGMPPMPPMPEPPTPDVGTISIPDAAKANNLAALDEKRGGDFDAPSLDLNKLGGSSATKKAEAAASAKESLTSGKDSPNAAKVPSLNGATGDSSGVLLPTPNISSSKKGHTPQASDSSGGSYKGVTLGDSKDEKDNSKLIVAGTGSDSKASFFVSGATTDFRSTASGKSVSSSNAASARYDTGAVAAAGYSRGALTNEVDTGTVGGSASANFGEKGALAGSDGPSDDLPNEDGTVRTQKIDFDSYLAKVGTQSLFDLVHKRHSRWGDELEMQQAKKSFEAASH